MGMGFKKILGTLALLKEGVLVFTRYSPARKFIIWIIHVLEIFVAAVHLSICQSCPETLTTQFHIRNKLANHQVQRGITG